MILRAHITGGKVSATNAPECHDSGDDSEGFRRGGERFNILLRRAPGGGANTPRV